MKNPTPPITASLGFGIAGKVSNRPKHRDSPPTVPRRNARILVVNSDPSQQRLMKARLQAAHYEVDSADSGAAAIDACTRFRPNLVISDLRMEPMDGLALLGELKTRWPDISVIILTAHGTIPEAVRATQNGAFGFLVQPIEKAELLGQVQRAIAASAFTHSDAGWRADIVSRSQLMEDRLVQANRAARSDVPVLMSGEHGTEKEVFARAIHIASRRRERPFLVVQCINEDEKSLETELFGSEDDAADTPPRVGSLQAAKGGTILLEDIADLPFRLQVRLAAALRECEDIGGTPEHVPRYDVRLICSTSVDLQHLVSTGGFQDDLFYRISVLRIEVPPLGRRREDIPLLVSRFLEQAAEEGGTGKIYSPGALQLLATADWPGNVRQLFDLVKQNVASSPEKVMTEKFVKHSLGGASTKASSYDDARNEFSKDYLVKNLQSTSGNISQSARLAKRSRTDFYKLLSRYSVEPDEYEKVRVAGPRRRSKSRDP